MRDALPGSGRLMMSAADGCGCSAPCGPTLHKRLLHEAMLRCYAGPCYDRAGDAADSQSVLTPRWSNVPHCSVHSHWLPPNSPAATAM